MKLRCHPFFVVVVFDTNVTLLGVLIWREGVGLMGRESLGNSPECGGASSSESTSSSSG
jgi:hypothetical protein